MPLDAGDLLWLLLPLAAASGWAVARLDQRRRAARSGFELPAAYFRGLNFLLNEQPDKAIEVFVKAFEVDSGTVETHLALGNLFRRRGEVERAIRIHQNLIARPNLDKQQRSYALLELGQDYLKAGLLDRAESLFVELAEIRVHTEQALRFLVHIYEQEREWDKAIAACRRLARIAEKDQDAVIAQYHCELADEAVAGKHYAQARKQLAEALAADRHCVRASMLLGRIEAAEGRYREAIRAWQRIEEQDPHFLGEVAPDIAECYRKLDDEHGLFEYFNASLARHHSVAVMLALADIVQRRDGVQAAEDFVADWLRRNPSVHGLHRLLLLNIEEADSGARDDLVLLRGIIENLMAQHQGYICLECGFRGKLLYWRCPSCHRWSTVMPLVDTEAEAVRGGKG
jgi:lipopolysaccharide assembly protein B